MAEPAAAVVASVADQAPDLADLLGQRSPGTRTQAELTKDARIAAKTRRQPKAPPHELTSNGPKTAELVDLLSPPLAPVAVVAEGLAPPLTPPSSLNAIVGSAPIIGSFTPPSDGGGPPAHFPTSEPRQELPQSAVPEPGTWAMMLFGFGLIGWRMRRRRATQTKLA